MRAPTTRKGHAAKLTTTTESEGQAATPQGARDGGKGKGRPTLRLAQEMPMMKSHEITPTYLFSYLSFLLLPLVLQLRASARHCLVVFLPSRAAAQQESKSPESDPAIIDGGPDAATRKSVHTLG